VIDATEVTKTDEAVLEELEKHRAELRTWHEKRDEYSREATAVRARSEQLESEAAKLVHNNPLLINGENEPVGRSNPVAKVRAELAKLPDLDAIYRRRDHADAVVQKLTADLREWILDNFEQLHVARFPQAVEVRDQLRRYRDDYLAAAGEFLAFCNETVALASPHPEYTGRDVAGINEVSELIRVLEKVEDLPLPTIHGTGPEVGGQPEAVFVERPTDDEDGDQ
jgi:hypothetical protein